MSPTRGVTGAPSAAAGPDGPRPTGSRPRGFSPLRDLPAVLWLFAAGVVAVVHADVPAPRWLLIHLVVLGAASHSILVWSQYFADTLLHTPTRPGARLTQSVRLGLLNAGAVLVMAGVLGGRWPLVAVGATGVALAAGWHAVALGRQLRRALPARFRTVVRYYIAAASLLPVGALFGAVLARGDDDSSDARVLVAHVVTNAFGWLGLTVLGTVVTLWPTMLRTRLVEGAERAATRALPVLAAGVLVTMASALVGVLPLAALGLLGYLAGLVLLTFPFVRTVRAKHATDVPTWSTAAAMAWFMVIVGYATGDLATAGSWPAAQDRLEWVTPALAAGFVAQLLVGAMSYLLPVVLGGGPSVSRRTNAAMGRFGALRVVLLNGGLAVALPPTPPLVQRLGWSLVVLAVVSFLALVVDVNRVARLARSQAPDRSTSVAPGPGLTSSADEHTRAGAIAGVAVVALAVALGVGAGPGARTTVADAVVAPTGVTTTVTVVAHDMRFTPSTVHVPAGNRLVVTVDNTDPSTSHDLTFGTGATTGLLAPGARGVVDVGVVSGGIEGWCSVPGHRQLGMVLHVVVDGGPGDSPTGTGGSTTGDSSTQGRDNAPSSTPATADASNLIDLTRSPGPGFTAYPAALPAAMPGTVHRVTLHIETVIKEVAPGVTQQLWTYNGTAPGPILHGHVGDVFVVTLVNQTHLGHSIDFHAGQVAPDVVMRTIPPGGTAVYTFTATHAGIWMYHCSTAPMSVHIANGMFGAVVIDPPGLDHVDHEYVLLQSELYLGAQGGPVDAQKVKAETPDLVVFNGYADQYDARPLTAKVGQRVRIWVLDVGPNRATSFHIVGGQFDTVYAEGAYLLRRSQGSGASQTLGLDVAQGGFVETTFSQPGHYPFVSHVMVDAERGAHGVISVSP